MTSKPDAGELKRLRTAATQGEWTDFPDDHGDTACVRDTSQFFVCHGLNDVSDDLDAANMAFIAYAANHAVGIIESLERTIRKMNKSREDHHAMTLDENATLREQIDTGREHADRLAEALKLEHDYCLREHCKVPPPHGSDCIACNLLATHEARRSK